MEQGEAEIPQVRRVAAYAVIVRDERILLSRLAPRISATELWTLPGGGLDHGEPPRDAVVREIWEESGLAASISDSARVYSGHMPGVWRDGRRIDAHAVRIVYTGRVPPDAPAPRVVEVDGSTVESAWVPVAAVEAGEIPVVTMVREALADLYPARVQRIAAYALITRDRDILLTRLGPRTPDAGAWILPGGGIEHGESPAEAAAREVAEECGVECRIGELIGVDDVHFTGVAPDGSGEDYHGIHLVFAGAIDADADLRLAETGGTTDAVAWVSREDIATGAVKVVDLVSFAITRSAR
ncbi:MAG: NUDIX domain-containing protein [Nocardioides sp.]